jgi:hypothetical protein
MNFNGDDPENNRIDGGGEIDLEQINRASQNVRFYNRVIRASIFFIIVFGAGCGIYLYSYISSGVSNEVPVQSEPSGAARSEKNAAGKGPQKGTETPPGAPAVPASAVSGPVPGAAKVTKQPDKKSGSGHASPAIASSSPAAASPAASTGPVSISGPAPVAVAAVTVKTPRRDATAENNVSRPASNDRTAGIAAVKETSGVEVGKGVAPQISVPATKEASLVPAVPKFIADTAKIEKLLAAAKYDEFEKEAAAALSNKNIAEESSARLNTLMAKRAYFTGQNPALAQKHILKVKNIIAGGVCDYAVLYIYLFGPVSKLRCAQLINYINQNSSSALKDAEKVEIAKALARNGLYDESQKTLNRVIAASRFETEMENVKSYLKKYGNSLQYQAARKARENFDYSIDSITSPDAPFPVKIARTTLLKLTNAFPVACLPAASGTERSLYAYCRDLNAYEISLSRPGTVGRQSLSGGNHGFELAGVFNISGRQHAAEFKKASMYQLAPINNAAARSRYLPPYFEKKEFGHIFMISDDGNRLARFIRDPKSDNSASLEIVNINDRKVIFKADRVFIRESDLGFADFSADMVKYSIDYKLECRQFYYFRHAGTPGDTAEAGIKLKLFSVDLDKLEEKPLLAIEINKASDLNICYLDSSAQFMFSYHGKNASAAALRLRSGSWLLNKDMSGTLYLGEQILRCAVRDPEAKGRFVYAFDPSRSEVACYEIVKCEAAEYINYAEGIFSYYPDHAVAALEELLKSGSAGKITPAGLKKLEASLAQRKEELVKSKNADFLMAMTTCLRMGLPSFVIELINGYIQDSSSLTDEESRKILELKKEAETVLANDK